MNYFKSHTRNDLSKFVALIIIFLSISFLVLTTFNRKYDFSYNIIHIRIWQYLLAFFSGGALGVAGLLLQKLTKNILSDISILGIGSLNIICIIFYIFFSFDGTKENLANIKVILPIISIISSIIGTGLIYYLSNKNKKNSNQFIIVGISIQFLFEAINLAALNLMTGNNETNNLIGTEINNYSYGKFPDIVSLSLYSSWRIVTIISFILIALIVIFVYCFKKEVDLIEINEELAKTNGVKIDWIKKILFLCVALLAGIESALVGTISLLGIVAPNIAKLIFGNRSSTNIFASFLIGGILVLIATFFSVNLSQNIPIGILSTALIVPVFIYLILKKR